MEQYNVTGMSCAACSARVEKAVSKVPGVTACSVSLLTNSMGVEGTASPQEIIHAVESAGYGASAKGKNATAAARAAEAEDALADHDTPVLRKRLISSLVFLVILMYFSMGLAGSCFFPGELCCLGTAPAVADGSRYGDQPEVFYQRFSEPIPSGAQYGYPGGVGGSSGVCL